MEAMTSTPLIDHLADASTEFRYPAAGDEPPPGGAKVLLLTRGHICVSGTWSDAFIGWAPLPKRNKDKEQRL